MHASQEQVMPSCLGCHHSIGALILSEHCRNSIGKYLHGNIFHLNSKERRLNQAPKCLIMSQYELLFVVAQVLSMSEQFVVSSAKIGIQHRYEARIELSMSWAELSIHSSNCCYLSSAWYYLPYQIYIRRFTKNIQHRYHRPLWAIFKVEIVENDDGKKKKSQRTCNHPHLWMVRMNAFLWNFWKLSFFFCDKEEKNWFWKHFWTWSSYLGLLRGPLFSTRSMLFYMLAFP